MSTLPMNTRLPTPSAKGRMSPPYGALADKRMGKAAGLHSKMYALLAFALLATVTMQTAHAQVSSIETTSNNFFAGSGPTGNGPTVAAQTVILRRNTDNPGGWATVATATPITVTYELSNQQYTMAASETPTLTGVFFGGISSGSALASAALTYPQLTTVTGRAFNTYFTSTGTTTPGTGIFTDVNGGVYIGPSARALANAGVPVAGRYQMADVTLTFNQPVNNPVLQVSGLGGTETNGLGGNLSFTSELELLTPGLSLTRLSGNSALVVVGNAINNARSDAALGGACNWENTYQAACGSVRVNGTGITSVSLRIFLRGSGTATSWQPNPGQHEVAAFVLGVSVQVPDMRPVQGATTPTVVRPGQVFTGLTLQCINDGPSGAMAATCVPEASVGTISALTCTPTPPAPVNFGTGTTQINCTFTYTAPGVQGGVDEAATTVAFTGTTGDADDINGGITTNGNNQATVDAVVLDAVDDADTKAGGLAATTTDLAPNDQTGGTAPTFGIRAGSTCTAVSVSAAGLATYDTPASGGCIVNYQLCPTATLNAAECDNAVLTVTAAAVVTVQLAKISQGAVGSFDFTLTNLGAASDNVTTTTAGTTALSAQTHTVIDLATAVTLTEAATPTFDLSSASCTDTNAASTGNPPTFGTLAASVLTIAPTNLVDGAQIVCTFTNALQVVTADVSMTMTNTPLNGVSDQASDTVVSRSQTTYQIVVSNAGPAAADGAVLVDPAPTPTDRMTCTSVACTSAGGATCPSPLTVADLQSPGVAIPILPANGSVTVSLDCTID